MGTLGIVQIFIKDFALIAKPLVNLTRKGVELKFSDTEQASMDALKDTLIRSPVLKPVNYHSDREVILAVDSSIIGVGYILLQLGANSKRYPNRFGSITWNKRERNYLQAKVKLYGLM